jgi:molecular chaperone DnaK
VFQMEKMLAENRDKIDEAARADVERGITEAKKVLEANKDAKDAATFKTAFDDLQKASYKMAEQMYKQAGAGASSSAGTDGGSTAPGATPEQTTQEQKDVIDAEFEEHH